MASTRIPRTLWPVLGLALLAAPACNAIIDFDTIEGSGVPETTAVDVPDFDEIEVSGTFEVDVTIADGPTSVEITVDDNLIDDLDVRVDGDRLHVGFERGSYELRVTPTAVISVARLEEVELSGASDLDVDRLDGDSLDLRLSGASHLRAGELSGESLRIDLSGASEVVAGGSVSSVTVDASGASHADLAELAAGTVSVDASGASRVELGRADRVTGDLSGASVLVAPAAATGTVETSGSSRVERS